MSVESTASAARRSNKQSTTLTFTLMATPILNAMELERKMYLPDCDNPSGRYPARKYACDDCGEKTAIMAGLCSKCRAKALALFDALHAETLEEIKNSAFKMEAEETNPRLKRCLGKIARQINVPDSSRLICEVAGKSQPE